MMQVVEDFGLLRFTPLHVEDKHSMAALLRHIDNANGHAFTGRPDAQALSPYSAVATGARMLPCELEGLAPLRCHCSAARVCAQQFAP